jgi:hypothetical protein
VFSGLPATKAEVIGRLQQELRNKPEPSEGTNDIILERGMVGECIVDVDGFLPLQRLIKVLEQTDFEQVAAVEGFWRAVRFGQLF